MTFVHASYVLLWILATPGSYAISSLGVTLTNSDAVTIVCFDDDVLYECVTQSTVLDWSVSLRNEASAGIQFDASINVPGEGSLAQLTGDVFVYAQLIDVQTSPNGTEMTSQLSTTVSMNNAHGTVSCTNSVGVSVSLEYILTGVPGDLQDVVVNKLFENVDCSTYTYQVIWKPPANTDSIALRNYFIELDDTIVVAIVHTNQSEYKVNIIMSPGNHVVAVYGRDRCNQSTAVASIGVSVPQPSISDETIVLLCVGIFFWTAAFILFLIRSFMICRQKTTLFAPSSDGAPKCVCKWFWLLSITLLAISACMWIASGVSLTSSNVDSSVCVQISTYDILAIIAFVLTIFGFLSEMFGLNCLIWLLASSRQPHDGIKIQEMHGKKRSEVCHCCSVAEQTD